MKIKPITIKLILMNFLEFAVWGAYLTSIGRYLGDVGMGPQIKWFFMMQGLVSINGQTKQFQTAFDTSGQATRYWLNANAYTPPFTTTVTSASPTSA